MTDSEYEVAMAMVGGLWSGFKKPPPGAVRDMWLRILGDVSTEDFSSALSVLVERGQKFAPGLSEIKATVNEMRMEAAPLWSEVWAEILEHVRNAPDLKPVQGTVWPALRPWSAPVIGQLVDLVGWGTVSQCYDEDLGVLEAQCRNKYEALVKRAQEDRVLARIPGDLPRLEQARQRSEGFASVGDVIRLGNGS
ncbi:MAG: hypothetical protein ACYDD0_00920 [Candidatus Dormibacteria bacterium]